MAPRESEAMAARELSASSTRLQRLPKFLGFEPGAHAGDVTTFHKVRTCKRTGAHITTDVVYNEQREPRVVEHVTMSADNATNIRERSKR